MIPLSEGKAHRQRLSLLCMRAKVSLLAAVVASSAASPCHMPYSKLSNTSAGGPEACAKAPVLGVGVIGGMISFTLPHTFQWVLDHLSSKGSSASGRTALKSLSACAEVPVYGMQVSLEALSASHCCMRSSGCSTTSAARPTAPLAGPLLQFRPRAMEQPTLRTAPTTLKATARPPPWTRRCAFCSLSIMRRTGIQQADVGLSRSSRSHDRVTSTLHSAKCLLVWRSFYIALMAHLPQANPSKGGIASW